MVIGDIIDRNLWRYHDKIAMVFEHGRLSFEELSMRVFKLGNALMSLGLKKGDSVAFMLPHNMIQAQEIVFALTVSGMYVVPLNSRFLIDEILQLVDKCEVKSLIFEETYLDLIKSNRSKMKKVQNFIRIGSSSDDEIYDYEDLISQSSSAKPTVDVNEEDVAALIHTSGTTGMPKEVMWTHKSWLAGSRDIVIKFQLTDEDTLLIFTPYYHIPFFWFNMALFYMGGRVILIREPTAKLILDAIQKEKITTVSHFVPTTLLRLLNFPDLQKYELTSVRWLMYGGAPMPVPLLERAIPILGNKFIQLYGFTELAGCATALSPEDHSIHGTEKELRRLSSCGKEMPSSDIRIVDSGGRPVAVGDEGEIVYRSDNLMKGYWKEPEETKKVLKNGWFYTGDMASFDEDKYIHISGRKKDIIISGGENITPKQVEDIIYKHLAVESAAVIGVPDPVWGEAVKAVIVLKKGKKATEDEIIKLCKEELAHYKAPKSVDFVESLPVTHTGKIKRWELRERYSKKIA
ncbi:MAG: AMP-binding protein [Deltaproteobacteria bacterium]|nr:MAG: AMP-binding protein [Deltaproteobacteria bacterium]